MEKDFTLKRYKKYLIEIKKQEIPFLIYNQFIINQDLNKFCLIRHDVDRKPRLALKMAELEYDLEIKSTYYFRIKSVSFNPKIIKKIEKLGHEIGYHYESLSDCNGNKTDAVKDFKSNLSKLNKIAKISTCSMHGRPFKPFDNRDIWKIPKNHEILTKELGLLGEIYLDIDYLDIAYINDTGRNWTSGKNNIRDKVESRINADFYSGQHLLQYLKGTPHKKIVFQIHPERWTDNFFHWWVQQLKDFSINILKKIIS